MFSLKVVSIRFQRNGICGKPFHSLQLEGDIEGDPVRFIATVMEGDYSEDANGNEVWGCNGECAVQEIDAEGNLVDSGWRGDQFEGALRRAIEIDQPVALRYADSRWSVVEQVVA